MMQAAGEARAASLRLELSEPAPAQAPVGSTLTIRVRAECSSRFDRRGMTVELIAPGGETAHHAFTVFDGTASETDDIALTVPLSAGEHQWRVLLPAHEAAGVRHAECALPVSIRAAPHATSLAVWAVPATVAAGARFTIKAGAKSSGGCDLAGGSIEICDATGAVLASACLGTELWPGTQALHFTEVALTAPPREGLLTLSARFAGGDVAVPHEGTASEFHIAVARPPEHRLRVKVVARETAAPIEQADIRVGAERAVTDAAGIAEVGMGKGRYELHVWKAGYEAPPTTVEIGADAFVQIEVATLPEEDPDARWKM
jgi:hypothetical protein